jgi:hypothetical protein
MPWLCEHEKNHEICLLTFFKTKEAIIQINVTCIHKQKEPKKHLKSETQGVNLQSWSELS